MAGNKHVFFSLLQIVQKVRSTFRSGRTKPIDFRERQLKQLLRMFEENTTAMVEALRRDMNKVGLMVWQMSKYTNIILSFYYNKCNFLQSEQETLFIEINVVTNEAKNCLFHLKEWTEPEKVRNIAGMLLISYKYSYYSLQVWIYFSFPVL
jgi:aldehyde dehydrogenase (NAD+)